MQATMTDQKSMVKYFTSFQISLRRLDLVSYACNISILTAYAFFSAVLALKSL